MELQSRRAELEHHGLGLASILYDSPETIRAFTEARGIEFPILSDVGSVVIRQYDLLNREVEAGSPIHGIPYPGTFILDPSGRVTDRFFEARYQERFTVSSILTRLVDSSTGTQRNATRLQTDHLQVVAHTSDEVVAPGNRFSLILNVTPKPGMHVYAPGDHAYQVIRLGVDAPEYIQSHEMAYPPSAPYHFEPLDETVPVYQAPFRVVQEVTIPMSEETGTLAAEPDATLSIEATLSYQACDDEIYHLPAEVPLSWTLEWRGLVRD